jgi:hypothetical protein
MRPRSGGRRIEVLAGCQFVWRRRAPSTPSAADTLRPYIYADAPLDECPPPGVATDVEPWASFVLARAHVKAGRLPEAISTWRAIADNPEQGSRHRLQAWQLLPWAKVQPPEDQQALVLCAAAEVAVGDEHDLLLPIAIAPCATSTTPVQR